MTNLRAYLESALGSVISSWNEKDIYAISFLVCANEIYEYDGCSNVTEFSVSYNTETAVGHPLCPRSAGTMPFGGRTRPIS